MQMGKITLSPSISNKEYRSIFDDILDDWNNQFFSPVQTRMRNKSSIKTKDKETIISIEMPGFSKEETKVTVRDNILSINAEKTDKTAYFSDTYSLSKSHDPATISAKLENGILTITIPISVSPVRTINIA